MKNNEDYNSKQKAARVKRALRIKRKKDKGASVIELAAEYKVTTARIYKLISDVS